MMSIAFALLGSVLMILGSIAALVGALGLLRLPDLYTRLHAAGLIGPLGAGLIFLAVAVVSADGATALRAILGIAFLMLTSPVSAHLLARAAHQSGYLPLLCKQDDYIKGQQTVETK